MPEFLLLLAKELKPNDTTFQAFKRTYLGTGKVPSNGQQEPLKGKILYSHLQVDHCCMLRVIVSVTAVSDTEATVTAVYVTVATVTAVSVIASLACHELVCCSNAANAAKGAVCLILSIACMCMPRQLQDSTLGTKNRHNATHSS